MLQGDINKQYSKEGIKLSINDFVIKATGLASRRVPECNSHWVGDAIRYSTSFSYAQYS